MEIRLTINGDTHEFDVNPNITLMDFLRNQGYHGVKNGCAEGSCGSCVVLVDDLPKKSCLLFIGQVNKRRITTIEGISKDKPHPLQDEFVHEAGIQCGYCIPGMILSANALLLKNPSPSDEEIKNAIDGNLCRCTGYTKQIKAIKKAAERIKGER